jgi:hypothetical protein
MSRTSSWLRFETGSANTAADIAVAVFKQIDIFLHSSLADAARDLLIHRHRRGGDCRAHCVVAIPGLDASDNAVPFEHILVRIGDHASLQCNDRIRNLEGRGRQHRLSRTILVAGDHEIIVGLVADEGANRALIGKPLGQILANLAALGRDIGKAARRQEARDSKETERMATIDHGNIRRR